MLRRLVLALLIAAAPTLALAQSYGVSRFDGVITPSLTLGGFTLTGVGTTAGTLAAGNDSRIVGATQNAAAAITGGTINGTVIGGTTPAAATFTTLAASGLTLGTPLPLSQGGCGATTALGCLGNLGLSGGTLGYVLTSNGPGTAPTYQAIPASGSANAVLFTAQSLTSGQQDQVRFNLSGPASAAPSASATLATTDIDRPLFPTGTITLTVPNGGAGWRTGPIKNANTTTGLVTLAIPSGATLDGTTNGTTILYPYQRARIIQTGATAYVTDWVERSPVIQVLSIASGSPVALASLALPVGYTRFEIDISNANVTTNGQFLYFRLSNDGGSTFKSGASDYFNNYLFNNSGVGGGSSSFAQGFITVSAVSNAVYAEIAAKMVLIPGKGSGSVNKPVYLVDTFYTNTTPAYQQDHSYGYCGAITDRANAIQFYAPSGNIYGNFNLRALP